MVHSRRVAEDARVLNQRTAATTVSTLLASPSRPPINTRRRFVAAGSKAAPFSIVTIGISSGVTPAALIRFGSPAMAASARRLSSSGKASAAVRRSVVIIFLHWRRGPTAPQRGCRVGDPARSARTDADASPRIHTSSARRATPARLPRWGPRCGRRRLCFWLALVIMHSFQQIGGRKSSVGGNPADEAVGRSEDHDDQAVARTGAPHAVLDREALRPTAHECR